MLLNFKRPSLVADKDKSNCIFGAVAFYMKHLGVKTRALDNKKTKSGWRPSVPSVLKPWGTNKPNKIDKKPPFTHDVKPTKPNVPPRVSICDGGATSGWKPGVAGSGSTHGSESSEELTISVSVTPSPDSQSDTGVNNNRSDPKPVSEGGDASPVSTGGSLSICEPLSVIDMLPDDSQDSGKEGGKTPCLLCLGECAVSLLCCCSCCCPQYMLPSLRTTKTKTIPYFAYAPPSLSPPILTPYLPTFIFFSAFCRLLLFFTSVCLFLVPPDVLQCQSFLLAFSLQFICTAVFLRIQSALCPAMLRQGTMLSK